MSTVAIDRFVVCPTCDELANRGATCCDSCGGHLYENEPRGIPFLPGNEFAGQFGTLLCPNCLVTFDESGFCGLCGKQQMVAAASAAVAQVGRP